MAKRRTAAETKAEARGRARERAGAAPRISDNGKAPLPDNTPRLYDSVSEVMRGMIQLINGVLINSDMAYRKDRSLQRSMRHDPDVMAPLFQRQLAVAMLDYDIVAEDEEDDQQVEQASELKSLIEQNLRRRTDFLRHMQEAIWFGPAAVNMIYQRVDSGIAPTSWRSFHSDTLIFTETGGLGMRVGIRYPGSTFPSWDGLGHLFDATEREAIVLHTWMPQGPDYEELEQGRYLYAGRGLRDVVWFQWLMKQVAMQLWMSFIERYSMGIRVGTYPNGDGAAKTEMETVLKNLLGDISVTMPDDSAESASGKSRYSIEILDPAKGGTGTKIFADLIEGYLAGQIKEMIIGQTATTEATNTGLGSDVGTRHAETFNRLIKYDALALADSLTHDFVHRIHAMNWGDTPYKPRWVFALEDVDSEKFLTGVQSYVDMGGTVSKRQVRERLGFDEPGDDEDILGGMDDPFALGSVNGSNGARPPFGGGGLDGDAIRRALQGNGNNSNKSKQ